MNRHSKAHRVAYDNPNLEPLSHDLQGSMESGLFLLGGRNGHRGTPMSSRVSVGRFMFHNLCKPKLVGTVEEGLSSFAGTSVAHTVAVEIADPLLAIAWHLKGGESVFCFLICVPLRLES